MPSKVMPIFRMVKGENTHYPNTKQLCREGVPVRGKIELECLRKRNSQI